MPPVPAAPLALRLAAVLGAFPLRVPVPANTPLVRPVSLARPGQAPARVPGRLSREG